MVVSSAVLRGDLLALSTLALACAGRPTTAPGPRSEPTADACTGQNGLVVEVPPIEAAWDGAGEAAGTVDAAIRWCGPGELALGTAHLGWPDGSSQDWERDLVLSHGEVRLRVHGRPSSAEGALEVRGQHGGEPVVGRAVVRSMESRARTAAEAACAARGGTFAARGLSGAELCDAPTADAGQPCRTSRECESRCIADDAVVVGAAGCASGEERVELRGHCFERTLVRGCLAVIEDVTTECRRVGSSSRLPVVCID